VDKLAIQAEIRNARRNYQTAIRNAAGGGRDMETWADVAALWKGEIDRLQKELAELKRQQTAGTG